MKILNKFIFILLLFLIPNNISAQDNTPKFALIIDQVNYSTLAKLNGAKKEADQIAASLDEIGFEITRKPNLNKDQLFKTINDFRRKVAQYPNAIIFIYYTGHGARDPSDDTSENFLIGIDGDLKDASDLPIYGVKLSNIIESFTYIRAKAVILVIDACRVSASFGKASSKGLNPSQAGRNILVAYATGINDIAEVGVYAPVLANELKKSGQDISTVFQNVKFSVNAATNKKQLPWLDDKLEDRICLVSCEKIENDKDDILKSEQNLWSSISDCSGYELYLKIYPNGIYNQQAKQKIQSSLCDKSKNNLKNQDNQKAEKDLWASIENCEGYNLYLKLYPNGLYTKTALDKKNNVCTKTNIIKPNPIPDPKPNNKTNSEIFALAKSYYDNSDYYNAATNFKIACNNNEYEACSYLSILTGEGKGIAKDLNLAFNLANIACENNIGRGCSTVGVLYWKGEIVTQSNAIALKYFEKSCGLNSGHGCFNLGSFYEGGIGVTKSIAKAIAMYEKGCNLKSGAGCNNLGMFYANGNGVTLSLAKAKELFIKSCDLKTGQACDNLGQMFEKGHGVTRNISIAKNYYTKACKLDYEASCKKLN